MFPAILPGQSFTNTYLIACDNKIPSLNVPYQMTFILSGSPSRDFKQAYSSFEFCHGMKAIGKDTTDVPIHLFFQHHLKGNRAGIGQNASAWVSQDKFLDDWKNNSKHTSSFSLETNAIERWFDQFGIKDHSISGYIKVIEQKLGINRVYIVASRNVQGDIVIYASLKIDLSNGLPCLLELRFTGDSFRQSQITLKHSMDYEEIPYAVCKSIQGILLS